MVWLRPNPVATENNPLCGAFDNALVNQIREAWHIVAVDPSGFDMVHNISCGQYKIFFAGASDHYSEVVDHIKTLYI